MFMPESDELTAAIGQIKYKVDSMDRTLERLLRVNGKEMIAEYIEQFDADPSLAKIYLNIDGQSTQKDIADRTGISEATVTRRMHILVNELDLVELSRQTKDGKIYRYTKMEKIFNISKQIAKGQQK
jgi:DNA-binding MarR family transcriptional regulator